MADPGTLVRKCVSLDGLAVYLSTGDEALGEQLGEQLERGARGRRSGEAPGGGQGWWWIVFSEDVLSGGTNKYRWILEIQSRNTAEF